MTTEQIKVLRAIGDVIVEAVAESGKLGAPGGPIYAALMPLGITLEQYEGIMAGLVGARKLRKQGQLYFAVAAHTQCSWLIPSTGIYCSSDAGSSACTHCFAPLCSKHLSKHECWKTAELSADPIVDSSQGR